MSKAFVLGGEGFIGSYLIPKLQNAGYDVVTDMRYFDDKYDVIINLAAVTHTRNEFDPKMIESNIILVDKVFKRSERVIQASSCSAAHFTNPYSGTKLWAEYLAQKHGNALCLRFFNCYGSGNNKGIVWFLMNQKDGAKITIRGPELIRDYIAVENIVDHIIYRLEDGKGIEDVGSGVGTKTIDLVSMYSRLSGKTFEIETIPPDASEPLSMVSKNIIPHIDLETGLKKVIENAKS